MYAVIRTGGKQYKVAKNDVIAVERLAGEAGDVIALDQVLLLGDGAAATIGSPLVGGACVAAEVLQQAQADKVLIFKKKRRHNYRRKKGHRQQVTVLRVTDILTDGKRPEPGAKAAPRPKAEPKAATEKKPAAKKAAAKKKAAAPKAPAKKAAAKKAAPQGKTGTKTAAKSAPKKK
jgi:large subunit ribosomal protein L21